MAKDTAWLRDAESDHILVSSVLDCQDSGSLVVRDTTQTNGEVLAANAITFSVTDGTTAVSIQGDHLSTIDLTATVAGLLGTVASWRITQTVAGTTNSQYRDFKPCLKQQLRIMDTDTSTPLSTPLTFPFQLANALNSGITDASRLETAIASIYGGTWVYNTVSGLVERKRPSGAAATVLEESIVDCAANIIQHSCKRSDVVTNPIGNSSVSGQSLLFTDATGEYAEQTLAHFTIDATVRVRISPPIAGAVAGAAVDLTPTVGGTTFEVVETSLSGRSNHLDNNFLGEVERIALAMNGIFDSDTEIVAHLPSGTTLYKGAGLAGEGTLASPIVGDDTSTAIATIIGNASSMIGAKFIVKTTGTPSAVVSPRTTTSHREAVRVQSTNCGSSYTYAVIRNTAIAWNAGSTVCPVGTV